MPSKPKKEPRPECPYCFKRTRHATETATCRPGYINGEYQGTFVPIHRVVKKDGTVQLPAYYRGKNIIAFVETGRL